MTARLKVQEKIALKLVTLIKSIASKKDVKDLM